jgi:transcriptional regulator with XRE-family HTH domain
MMDDKEKKEEFNVGKAIREYRTMKGLSIEAMGQNTGLSPEQLIQIENGEVSPALGVLIKISKALDVGVGVFLGERPTHSYMIVRKDEMRKHPHFVSKESLGYGYSYITLGQEKKNRCMEPFLVILEPGAIADDRMDVHDGEEFIHVLEGDMEITLGQHKEVLHSGDSIYYEGSIPHFLKCHGEIPTKIVAVIYVPRTEQEESKDGNSTNDDHGEGFSRSCRISED